MGRDLTQQAGQPSCDRSTADCYCAWQPDAARSVFGHCTRSPLMARELGELADRNQARVRLLALRRVLRTTLPGFPTLTTKDRRMHNGSRPD